MNSSGRVEKVSTSIRAELESRKIKRTALGLFTKVLTVDYEDVQICSQLNTLITEIVTPNHRFVVRPNMNYESSMQSSANLLPSVSELPAGSSQAIITSGASSDSSTQVAVGAWAAPIPSTTYPGEGLQQALMIYDIFPPLTASDLDVSQRHGKLPYLNTDISSVEIFPVSTQDTQLGVEQEKSDRLIFEQEKPDQRRVEQNLCFDY